MKIALAQINTTIGDFEGNAKKILERLRWAEDSGADLIVFPELSICGYPPRDMLEKPSFVKRNLETVEEIASHTGKVGAVVGYASINETEGGKRLFNSAGLLHDNALRFVQHKALLPEYDVFDEGRHFEPAKEHRIYHFGKVKLGLTLCEDLWSRYKFGGRQVYQTDPVKSLSEAGADVILNLSASPYTIGKQQIRYSLVCGEAARYGLPVVYCNLVGGNDELVFDGRSFVADAAGNVVKEALAFEEDCFIIDLEDLPSPIDKPAYEEEEEVRMALVLGLRDYMHKCGFERAVIGISGGIDSSVVAALAASAIGPKNVLGVMLPSPYTQKRSLDDAYRLAENLGIITCCVSIDDIYAQYCKSLGLLEGGEVSVAHENIQARIRGNILMAISNREGALVVSTGNKSELSVGYCTLYGDMVGGFALISDIPKTMVYALAKHINAERNVIPQSILERPPTAELKPDQTDQDILPPYDILDSIMKSYVEDRMSTEAIIAEGKDPETVRHIVRLIDENEYKRRQAPPGIKITSKAFGSGRRCPIARKV
ncbi:MAG: NAD+ synthase [Pseudomonadota bacterium]